MKLRSIIVNGAKSLLRASSASVELQEKLMFLGKVGYWPDFTSPRSFCEKLNVRKLYSTDERYVTCSDKWAVREYVREKIGGRYLVPVVFSGDSITPEQLSALGDDIVVKATHDCGSSRIIRENTPEVAREVCAAIDECLKVDFGKLTNQWWYSHIPPRVQVEKFLESEDGGVPNDYKFFVFKRPSPQRPEFMIQVDYQRGMPEHSRTHYDRNLRPVARDDARDLRLPFPKLENHHEMVEVALALAEDFDHVRVDLYNVRGAIYFGELTVCDGGGRIRYRPRSFDFALGDLWNLEPDRGGTEATGKSVLR